MAGNVRGAMRPQGRSPPFLLIGLCVALCILGFNYWSLSYRNRELGGQILDLQDQVRRSMSKRMTAERRGATVVDELKKCENTLDMEKNEIARKESEVISLSEQLRNKVTEMTDCENKIKDVDEIRTNLKTCEENNIGINQELQKKKEELKAAIQQIQPPVEDAERCKLCKGQWTDEKKNFLNSLEKILGPAALTQLHDAGIDIGVYAQMIDAQHKLNQPNPAGNGQVLSQGQNNLVVNSAVNMHAQEQAQLAQQQQAQQQQVQQQPQVQYQVQQQAQQQVLPQDPIVQVQPQLAQNPQINQQPPIPAQLPAEVPQGQVVMAQGVQDNNVPQGQLIAQNPPMGNPVGGNLAETNVLSVNDESAAKVNNVQQAQNAVANNPPLGNLDIQHPGGDFVPVANPGVENAAQPANDGQQAIQAPAEKPVDPMVANNGPIVLDDPAQNRVDRPSDLNKTTTGDTLLMGLVKPDTQPLLPDVLLSAPNLSLSFRTQTQSVQTGAQTALHASQSNNTANNQTQDISAGLGLPAANEAVELDAQMKFKQNAGNIPIDDNAGKLLKDGSAKIIQGGIVQDEDSIDKMQHNMNMEDARMNHMKNIR